jgi:predicted metal-binding membrane protein
LLGQAIELLLTIKTCWLVGLRVYLDQIHDPASKDGLAPLAGSSPSVGVAGYLLVWGTAGLLVHAGITQVIPLLPSGEAAVRTGAVVFILAGVYQFTPLKDGCLRQCRSPLGFVAAHATKLRRGGLVGTQVGAVHGVFCLGCCWALMIVLILLGMMSLTWMAAVASVIFLEKTSPRAWPVSSVVGIALVAVGVALLVTGQALPAFA